MYVRNSNYGCTLVSREILVDKRTLMMKVSNFVFSLSGDKGVLASIVGGMCDVPCARLLIGFN